MQTNEKTWDFDKLIDRQNTSSVKWDPKYLRFQFGEGNENLLPLWVADMDFECPPAIYNAIVTRANHKIYGYSFTDTPYFEALISWYENRHKWKIQKEWVLTAPGIVPAINFIIQRYTQPGDKILIQTPVYYPFSEAILHNGRQIQDNPLIIINGKYRMNYEDLDEKLKDPRVKIAILCSPHNPIGRVWEREELVKFGELCLKHKKLIIADEIHCDLILPGNNHICFASISEEFAQNSITCNAGSKTFNIAGLQQSNIIISNDKIRQEFAIHLENLGLIGGNVFGKVALEAAYRDGKEWLDDLLKYLRINYQFLKQKLEMEIPGVKVHDLEGTYLVWVNFSQLGLSEQELKEKIELKARLAFDRGAMFGKNGEGFQRINIACPRSILEEAVQKLIIAFQS